MKLKIAIAAGLFALVTNGSAATYFVNNVVAGDTSDTLITNADGTLLSGGIVSIGYFATTGPSSSIADIQTSISNFTLVHSVLAGSASEDLGGAFAGYFQSSLFQGAIITTPNTLLGKTLYLFAGNASTLAGSTAWALGSVATIVDDIPNEQQYTASPADTTILGGIGTFSTFTGNSGVATGTFNTLQLAVIPEPSAALLGALGALGLLRRRRN